MKKAILLLAITMSIAFISCSKKDDSTTTSVTKATIVLTTSAGKPASGITVYAFDQDKWTVIGDDPLFANGSAASDSSGKAIFSNIEYSNVFTTINNNQNTFRFSAHYTISGVNKTKVTAVTFTKGEQKTVNLQLN